MLGFTKSHWCDCTDDKDQSTRGIKILIKNWRTYESWRILSARCSVLTIRCRKPAVFRAIGVIEIRQTLSIAQIFCSNSGIHPKPIISIGHMLQWPCMFSWNTGSSGKSDGNHAPKISWSSFAQTYQITCPFERQENSGLQQRYERWAKRARSRSANLFLQQRDLSQCDLLYHLGKMMLESLAVLTKPLSTNVKPSRVLTLM